MSEFRQRASRYGFPRTWDEGAAIGFCAGSSSARDACRVSVDAVVVACAVEGAAIPCTSDVSACTRTCRGEVWQQVRHQTRNLCRDAAAPL